MEDGLPETAHSELQDPDRRTCFFCGDEDHPGKTCPEKYGARLADAAFSEADALDLIKAWCTRNSEPASRGMQGYQRARREAST